MNCICETNLICRSFALYGILQSGPHYFAERVGDDIWEETSESASSKEKMHVVNDSPWQIETTIYRRVSFTPRTWTPADRVPSNPEFSMCAARTRAPEFSKKARGGMSNSRKEFLGF